MALSRVRFGLVVMAIAVALSGCMDIKAPGYAPSQACGGYTPNGDFVGYTCPRTPGY